MVKTLLQFTEGPSPSPATKPGQSVPARNVLGLGRDTDTSPHGTALGATAQGAITPPPIAIASEPPAPASAPRRVTECGACQRRFSAKARFCPYDGEPLTALEAPAAPSDPLLGTCLDGRYEVLDILGEGGMGRVYRVRHRFLARHFALKALRGDLSRDVGLAERFLQEARAAAAVSHPHVVQITDFGALPTGQPYFVMELLDGKTLSRMLQETGPLAPARVVRIIRQIAEALAAAHSAGIVHRDLKPDNVLATDNTGGPIVVKVLDFGLAKVVGKSRLTRDGIVFGTPHYMSPEQASGEPADQRSDIYALGVLAYELLTGRTPFESDTYMGVLTKHLYVAAPRPSDQQTPHVAMLVLDDFVLRCMRKDPQERYQDMGEVLAVLDAIPLPAESRRPLVSSPAKSLQPGKRRQRESWEGQSLGLWPWLVGGLATLAAAVLLLLSVTNASHRRAAQQRRASSSPAMATSSAVFAASPSVTSAPGAAVPSAPPDDELNAVAALASAALASSGSTPSTTLPGKPRQSGSARAPAATAPKGKSAAGSGKKSSSLRTSDILDPWAK